MPGTNERHNRISLTAKFSFATVFDCGNINVNKGQVFTLALTNFSGRLKWFADHDDVLLIKESRDTHSATITALKPGRSRIEIQHGKELIRAIRIKVTQALATGFNVIFDKPEQKG